ncbi:MAG TPA: hypothetical protein VFJ43_02305, partial [Bacteroidia bacterium]|nr:hypothetical protein [Bacteroidia bacterium]
MTALKRVAALQKDNCLVILSKKNSDLKNFGLTDSSLDTIKKAIADDRKQIQFCNNSQTVFVIIKGEKEIPAKANEAIRKTGAGLIPFFNEQKIKSVSIADADKKDEHLLAFAEGIALGNYQFLHYKVKNKEKETNALKQIHVVSKTLKDAAVNRLQIIVEAT